MSSVPTSFLFPFTRIPDKYFLPQLCLMSASKEPSLDKAPGDLIAAYLSYLIPFQFSFVQYTSASLASSLFFNHTTALHLVLFAFGMKGFLQFFTWLDEPKGRLTT